MIACMPYPLLSPDELRRRDEASGEGALSAEKLRSRRQRTGIGATAFAAEVGLSAKHYRNLEMGHSQPSPEALNRIANRLGCEPEELLTASAA